MLHPAARLELDTRFDAQTRADVAEFIGIVNGKTHQEIVALLDSRTEPKVVQKERSNPAGALRIIFAWGAGCLWYIGAFVKVNDADGERQIGHILPRAEEVKKWRSTV